MFFSNPYKVKQFKSAYLVPFYGCNNHCQWCYADYYRQAGMRPIKFETALRLIDLFAEIGFQRVILPGGEPTLYPKILDMIDHIVKRGMHPILVTNGRKLADRKFVAGLKDAGLKNIAISLQSADPEVHANISGSSQAFDETIQGIRNALESGIEVQSNTVLSDTNESNYQRLIIFLHDLGISEITINCCVPTLRSDKTYEGLLPPEPKQK